MRSIDDPRRRRGVDACTHRYAREASGKALLWPPLAAWLRTTDAAKFFYERDSAEAEAKDFNEERFLRRLSDANLVLDAAQYETLRRIAFDDGDPSLAAFRAICAAEGDDAADMRDDAAFYAMNSGAVEADAAAEADVEAPVSPSRKRGLSDFVARRIVASFLDPILACLSDDATWTLDITRRRLVVESSVLGISSRRRRG